MTSPGAAPQYSMVAGKPPMTSEQELTVCAAPGLGAPSATAVEVAPKPFP